nr:porin [uncultured Flavobacterium sp.]
MKKISFIILPFLFSAFNFESQAQELSSDSLKLEVTPYASLRGHFAVYDKEVALQENVSRIGAKVAVEKGNVTFLAATELHLNLFQGGASFNVDGNDANEFLDVQAVQNQRAFNNRVGYIGIDLNKYGTFTFGKQWSVYYDVAGYTDQFIIFGGTASATYVGGTDGGASGTGRASQAAIYRNQIGDFYIGAQAQMRGGNNDKFIDGYGFSAQYNFLSDFYIGASFNRVFLSDDLIDQKKIIGLDGQPTYYAGGLKYQGKKLFVSALAAVQKNGDFTQGTLLNPNNEIIHPAVVFNATGFEFFANYNFDTFGIHAGYNYYKPDLDKLRSNVNELPVNSEFEISRAIVGFSYQPLKFVQIYGEQRLAFGKNAMGQKNESVFALGMKIDVSKTFKSTISTK